MSSWKLSLSNGSATAILTLIDTAGPWNDYKFLDEDNFIPNSGSFTNQLKKVVPNIANAWVLHSLDIDDDLLDPEKSHGEGECWDSGGSFPSGPLKWKVIEEI